MSSEDRYRNTTASTAASGMLLVLLVGCGGYPEVSPQALELAKAVDNLCNLQDASQIDQAREIVLNEHGAGAITEAEHSYLLNILDMAASGDWDAAQQESRRLLEDQQQW